MDNEKMLESIRSLCKKNNISPSKLEDELGFSQGLISRWKDKIPSIDKIIDIADYFRVTLDEVIGRYGVNDDHSFIRLLYSETERNKIQWKAFSDDEPYAKEYHEDFTKKYLLSTAIEKSNYYETHHEISYYFNFTTGYISIYAMYENQNIYKPQNLILFIQPDKQGKIIQQPYNSSELLPLWLKVLESLKEYVPDEVKAEELKRQFISAFSKE